LYKRGILLKRLAWFSLFMAFTGLLMAQTADEMDRILSAQEVSYTQAAYFILTAADALPGGGDAFATARENHWLSAKSKSDGSIRADMPINLGEVSLLIMKAFDLKGGALYTLFPVPRYACRELVYLEIVQGRSDPGNRLDGRTFLHILGRVLSYVGDDDQQSEGGDRP
jgi:hypothetical protein